MAVALFRFDFHYADLIRWLGDMSREFRLAMERAPIAGSFSCTRASLTELNLYEHHPTVDNEKEAVWAKIAKEEALSYHIILSGSCSVSSTVSIPHC
jgi:hypothetical protein